ncbi:MAG TPA: DegQ family serine endoprotease [Stellaceae bacterium]|jgi:serine protease Do|nr:DegQ family serine endoprotease [Stellaceae bacterium]
MTFKSKPRGAVLAGVGLASVLALCADVWAQAPASSTATPNVPAPGVMMQQESFAPLVKRVLPAVVNISVTENQKASPMADQESEGDDQGQNFRQSPFDEMLRRFFDQQGQNNPFDEGQGDEGGGAVKRIALGSGFIIDADGHIVTNKHVVGDASKVEVTLQDGDKYTAKIIGTDARTDLAVLKIDAGKPLPYVSFGDSDAAQIGDWVVAVGNPFGLGGSVTTGIISARGRDIHTGQFDDFLQIDAPINRGNSGGPTFNLNGQVIGINTAIYSPNGGSVGIGFAVPSTVAKQVVSALEDHGKVERGWLGVQIQPVTPAIASSLGLKGDHGALVAVVTPNSPSAAAGLKQGDVILAFNGQEITKLRDLPHDVAGSAPGASASLTVWRDGKEQQVSVKLGEMPSNPQVASADNGNNDQGQPVESSVGPLGLRLASLTNDFRHDLHLGRDVHGVVITHVENGSVADNIGLARGDVIMSIDQQPATSPQEAADRLQDISKSPNKSALLLLNRHGVTQYLGVDLSKNAG